jgi:hypothetical protein
VDVRAHTHTRRAANARGPWLGIFLPDKCPETRDPQNTTSQLPLRGGVFAKSGQIKTGVALCCHTDRMSTPGPAT